MSLVEDQMRAANAASKEENRMAELDHRIELAKIRLAQGDTKANLLRVEEFKYRRTWNAMQPRRWQPCTELPVRNKRRF